MYYTFFFVLAAFYISSSKIAPRTFVTITIVIVILELALPLKLLIIITMVIIKDNNYLKFKANYIKDELLFYYHCADIEI